MDEVVDRRWGKYSEIIVVLRWWEVEDEEGVGMRIGGMEMGLVSEVDDKEEKGGKGRGKWDEVEDGGGVEGFECVE